MPYHLDADRIGLDALQLRIESTDLVPSRLPLLDQIGAKMEALRAHGIRSLAALRKELKTPGRLKTLAAATGIREPYLVLLRREIEGYFPKPVPLQSLEALPPDALAKLAQCGISNTATLFDAANTPDKLSRLAKTTGVAASTLRPLARLSDLMRIQWVSPTFAQMLLACGCDGTAKVAAANPETLCAALAKANAKSPYFKGTIGLRDVKRLVHAANALCAPNLAPAES